MHDIPYSSFLFGEWFIFIWKMFRFVCVRFFFSSYRLFVPHNAYIFKSLATINVGNIYLYTM